MLPEFKQQRAELKALLPSKGVAVIYRKCKCGRVYEKPIWCDLQTTCGTLITGKDVLAEEYSFDRGRLTFLGSGSLKRSTGLNAEVMILRNLINRAVSRISSTLLPGFHVQESVAEESHSAYVTGCEARLVWKEMEPVDLTSRNEGEIMEMAAPFESAEVVLKMAKYTADVIFAE